MIRFSLAAALLFFAAQFVVPGVPPASAAATSVGVSQLCLPDGRVGVTFSWAGNDPTAYQQWIDLSIYNNGWAPGSFVGAGPLSGTTNSFTWNGLIGGVRHYTRINQQLSNGVWDASATYAFDTPACPLAKQSGKLSPVLQRLADLAVTGTLAPTPEGIRAQLGQSAGPGSITFTPDGKVVVEATVTAVNQPLVDQMVAREGQILGTAPQYQTITLGVFPRRLNDMAALPDVLRMTEVNQPATGGGAVTGGGSAPGQ